MGLSFCLVKAIILGELELSSASSQHSKVSVVSAGLKTCKFGMSLSPESCSTGWWVGPSSPSPIES